MKVCCAMESVGNGTSEDPGWCSHHLTGSVCVNGGLQVCSVGLLYAALAEMMKCLVTRHFQKPEFLTGQSKTLISGSSHFAGLKSIL